MLLQGYRFRATLAAASSTTVQFAASTNLGRIPIVLAKDGRIAILTALPTALTISGSAGVKYVYADLAAPSGDPWATLLASLTAAPPFNKANLATLLRLLFPDDATIAYAAQDSAATFVMSTTAPDSESTTGRLPLGWVSWDGAAILSVASYGGGGESSTIAEVPRAYLAGLTIANGTDATNDLDIAVGVARDSTDAATLRLAAAITKRADATWAVGTGVGGMEAATTFTADTSYHIWLIRRSDTGVVDVLISASATAPTMPTNYDQKRRIGSRRALAGPAWAPFVQNGDRVRLTTSVLDITATNPGTSAVTRTLTSIPTGIVVEAWVQGMVDWGTSSGGEAYLSALDATDEAAGNTLATIGGQATTAGRLSTAEVYLKTNTSAQIRSRLGTSSTNDILNIRTLGWIDRRGRDD